MSSGSRKLRGVGRDSEIQAMKITKNSFEISLLLWFTRITLKVTAKSKAVSTLGVCILEGFPILSSVWGLECPDKPHTEDRRLEHRKKITEASTKRGGAEVESHPLWWRSR